MNKPRTLLLVIVAAIAAGAIFFLVREHQELQRLRAENAALRQELADARAALEELERLRRQNAALSTRAGDPNELARLRADSAALRKLRADLEKQTTATVAARATNTPPAAPPPLTAKGTAQLKPGESFVTGGWLMEDGKRGFALVTPTLVNGTDGQPTVMMESKLFAIPEVALAEVGLDLMVADGRNADNHGVTDGAATRSLLQRLGKIQGVDVLSAPSIATQPGRDATIQLGDANGGLNLRLQPKIGANGQGFDLDFDLGLTLSNGAKK
ncbi:MAG: hypothetical protein HY301_13765 [Verrucomicrobia bacterium]|nr:hypothetical protein [Verrucomicrobiota bacterium]